MKSQTVLVGLSVFAAQLIASGFTATATAEEKAIQIIVWLPTDAELEMVGQKMPGTGDVRRFQSPPLEVGKDFTYARRRDADVDEFHGRTPGKHLESALQRNRHRRRYDHRREAVLDTTVRRADQ